MTLPITIDEFEEFKEHLKSKSVLEIALLYKVSRITIYNWIKTFELQNFYDTHKKDKRKTRYLKLKK